MFDDFLGLSDAIQLDAGNVLFRKGEPANCFYIVKSGELQVLDGNHVYETVSKGGILGEMALVDGGRRSATVRAARQSLVIPFDEKRFLIMISQTPYFALRVMRVMSGRLRAMNERAIAMPMA